MRLRHWRMVLFGLAGVFATIFMGLLAVWLFAMKYTLTVAAGPSDGYGQRFVSALNEAFKPEEPRLRFRYLATSDSAASGKAIADGKADLAIMRSDVSPPPNGLVIVILRRDAIGLLVPGASAIKGFADLGGKRVGMLPGSHFNTQLFDALLAFHGVDPKKVTRSVVEGNDLTAAVKSKTIDAVFGIGPLGIGPIVEALAAMRRAEPRGKAPVFLPVENAAGFVKAHPAMETIDVPKGAFGGATQVPDDDDTTLALTWRLIAKDSMLNAVAGELARLLIVSKGRLDLLMPTAHQIIAPDTDDKSPYLPLHPGAAAYFNDDQESWFDRFEDVFYLVAMGGSVVASAGAAAAGYFRRRRRQETDLQALAGIMTTLSTRDDYDPDAVEAQLDAIVKNAIAYRAKNTEELDDPQSLQLALSEIRRQIAERRAALKGGTGT